MLEMSEGVLNFIVTSRVATGIWDQRQPEHWLGQQTMKGLNPHTFLVVLTEKSMRGDND